MNLRELMQNAAETVSVEYATYCATALHGAMTRFAGQQVTASLIGEKAGLGWDDATVFEMVAATPQLGIRVEQQQRVKGDRPVLRLGRTPMAWLAYWAYLGLPAPIPTPTP